MQRKRVLYSQEEMEIYSSVAAELSESVCRLLPDGTLTFVNDVFCRTFGKQKHELVNHRWQPVVFAEDLPLVEQKLKELSPSQPVVVIENRVIDGSGTVRWMQFTNRGFFSVRGKLLEILVVGRDITPQVRAELDLDDTRERWLQALEGSGLGVWDWDIEKNEIFFSEEWRRMLGYGPREEIRGGPLGWRNLVHPEDLADVEKAVGDHLSGITPAHSSEFRLRCKNGTWKWVHSRGRVMRRDAKGTACRMVGTTADISRRRGVEERERYNLQLVASGAPVQEVLDAIIRSLEAGHHGLSATVMLMDQASKTLRFAAAPSLPEEFRKKVSDIHLGTDAGCYGISAKAKGRVVCEDLKTVEPISFFCDQILEFGIRACWSEPLLGTDGRLLGTFDCYLNEAREPLREELIATANAARLAAMAIEHEQREKDLAASEERYARALRGTTDGLWDWNAITGELYLSPRWKEMLGFEDHEFPSEAAAVRELIHQEDLSHVDQARREHLEKRKPYEVELRLKTKAGNFDWFLARGRAEWSEDGIPQRMTGTLSDITARKTAEANYQRELAYNRALLENAAAFIAAMDEHGRLVHVSRSSQEMFGYSEEELIGRTPWEVGIMDTAEVMRSQERYSLLMKGETVAPVDLRLRTKEGKWRIVEIRSVVTRKPDGSPDRLIMSGIDLTERNLLQQEVLKIADQEQARLGHDLHDGVGQTMTGLVIMAEALEAGLTGEDKVQASRIVELLQQSVGEVRRMSHGMSPTSVRYRGLIGALQLLSETVQTNFRTPCCIEIDKSVQVTEGDSQTHLFRIAQEAVNNALRHGKPKQIKISLRKLSPKEAELCIFNNGKGIKKSSQPAGIGLRVMSYRAEMIRATVDILNQPRKGVSVVCRFPLD